MSERYRGQALDGVLHLATDLAAQAYLGTELAATLCRDPRCDDEARAMRPGFQPLTYLDVGAGPGTVLLGGLRLLAWSRGRSDDRGLLTTIRQYGEALALQSSM